MSTDQHDGPELPADADATFDQDTGRIKVDLGLAAGVPEVVQPSEVVQPGSKPAPPPDDPAQEAARQAALDEIAAKTRELQARRDQITPGPAPTGEEPLPPLVLDLNMNRVKMRELRACERILLAVYGVPYPVMPSLDTMPADLTIALITHKLLLHEGLDASRMTEITALEAVEPIRAAFSRAEEIDFASLGSRAPAEGEGAPPTDPTDAAAGNGRGRSMPPASTS